MRQAVLAGISALLMVLFAPVLLLQPIEGPEPETVMLVIEEPKQAQPAEQTVCLKHGGGLLELPIETYLTGVVLSEMPASFELEALKAQAVAARTFTMRQIENGKHGDCDLCSDSSCCQAWTSREDLEEKLGASWQQYWDKVEKAVADTAGEVLTYGGNYIDAVYFSCSGGTTEAAVAVWGQEVPYLQSVDSRGEEAASAYHTTVMVPLSQFQWILQAENQAVDLSGTPASWFGEVTYTDGNGVQTMEIGGQSFTGTRLRTLFELNSAKFEVAVLSQAIEFQVYGFGHRVGMSQYGANAMAQTGSSYKEILLHYYTGVELSQISAQ